MHIGHSRAHNPLITPDQSHSRPFRSFPKPSFEPKPSLEPKPKTYPKQHLETLTPPEPPKAKVISFEQTMTVYKNTEASGTKSTREEIMTQIETKTSYDLPGLVALGSLASIAAASIFALFAFATQKEYIPETYLSDANVEFLSNEIAARHDLMNPESTISKTIKLSQDALNIQIGHSTWIKSLTPSFLGGKGPDHLSFTPKTNQDPNFKINCLVESEQKITCQSASPLPHLLGGMSYKIQEMITDAGSYIRETLLGEGSVKLHEGNYTLNPEKQLPDLFAQLVNPAHLNHWQKSINGDLKYNFSLNWKPKN